MSDNERKEKNAFFAGVFLIVVAFLWYTVDEISLEIVFPVIREALVFAGVVIISYAGVKRFLGGN